MTDKEKIAKIEEIFNKFVDWANSWAKTEYRLPIHMVLSYQNLMVWLDYNYKAEADEIGREIIWKNFQRCVTVDTPDYGDLSAWID